MAEPDAVVAGVLRELHPQWNASMIVASIAVSLLGAFTSTQIMCQARASRTMSGSMVWAVLGSLTFGFCSIWSLHFIAMLACELDLPIGLDVPLTVLSASLAVFFTFIALSGNLIRERYKRSRRKLNSSRRAEAMPSPIRRQSEDEFLHSMAPLLRPSIDPRRPSVRRLHTLDGARISVDSTFNDDRGLAISSTDRLLPTPSAKSAMMNENQIRNPHLVRDAFVRRPSMLADTLPRSPAMPEDYLARRLSEAATSATVISPALVQLSQKTFGNWRLTKQCAENCEDGSESDEDDESYLESLSETSSNRRSSSVSEGSSFGLSGLTGFRLYKQTNVSARDVLPMMARSLYKGLAFANISKGLIWSIAITSMHYAGIKAMVIPHGYCTLDPWLVALSALISWIVCTVGIILMGKMEVNLTQQLLFSAVAASGVSSMHFTGMSATKFWSTAPPAEKRGYPPELAIAIVSVAITTCMGASGLLAHSATIARNKLAEVVQTRRKLWAAIAQKENAEAAALARSEFIASASHEIRTPLHQLQGYSDLLSRTQLSDEGRFLLLAIQHATKSLSMITNNVLDWSRLEKGEAICRPVVVDIRAACEAIMSLLPNRDDEMETDLLVVVAPNVPAKVFVDETYLHRIFMNLLSNAFKFTLSGYVMLMIETDSGSLRATVKDTGFGIPTSFLPQLFEPFKQAQIRGAERGTGLGLSIVKQLLSRMQGDVSVDSKCQQDEGVSPEDSGSTFTVTIPLSTVGESPRCITENLTAPKQVAILHDGKSRDLEGITAAWKSFGTQVVHAQQITDIPADPETIIWADLNYIKTDATVRLHLLRQQKYVVLVPYDNLSLLDTVVGSVIPPQILLIRKPLIWHRILRSIMDFKECKDTGRPDKAVRFAVDTNILERVDTESLPQSATSSRPTILLVEDNKLNQKLGAKMLRTLHYDVLIAEDGQEAIEILIAHDLTIDAILMDQSMPRKDGLTATKEIRAMEEAGSLSKRRPIIAVTAVVGPEAQSIAMDAGTDAFLPKPLSLAKLEQTLSEFVKT